MGNRVSLVAGGSDYLCLIQYVIMKRFPYETSCHAHVCPDSAERRGGTRLFRLCFRKQNLPCFPDLFPIRLCSLMLFDILAEMLVVPTLTVLGTRLKYMKGVKM